MEPAQPPCPGLDYSTNPPAQGRVAVNHVPGYNEGMKTPFALSSGVATLALGNRPIHQRRVMGLVVGVALAMTGGGLAQAQAMGLDQVIHPGHPMSPLNPNNGRTDGEAVADQGRIWARGVHQARRFTKEGRLRITEQMVRLCAQAPQYHPDQQRHSGAQALIRESKNTCANQWVQYGVNLYTQATANPARRNSGPKP